MKVAKLIAVIFHAQQPHNAIYTVYATLWSENGKIAQLMNCIISNCKRVMGTAGVQFYCPSICNIFTQFYCFFNVFRNFSQLSFVCTKKFFKMLPQIASISYLKTTVSCALYTYSKTLEYHLNSRSVQE